jgi:membrane-associated protease RseP (regulator of RpoE activity)
VRRYIKAIATILFFFSVLPHELGHFVARKLCNLSADAVVIGDPYKPSLFTWGWLRIGEPSLRYEGMVISNKKDITPLPTWKRIVVSFAGPWMDIVASYTVILLDQWVQLSNIFAQIFIVMLSIKLSLSAIWNMFPAKKKIAGGEEWSEYDGYKIWNTSKQSWFLCMGFIVIAVLYIFYELVILITFGT